MRKRALFKFAAVLLAALSCLAACGRGEEYDPYACFFEGDTVWNETVVLTEHDDGIWGGLIFEPSKIVEVRDYTLNKVYSPSEYRVEGNRIYATASSTMPYMTQAMLRAEEGADIYGWKPYDNGFVYTEGLGIVMHQIAVTYKHKKGKFAAVPAYVGDKMTNSIAKLKAGEDIEVFLIGDSISYGCSSSGFLGSAPYLPIYGQGFCDALSKRFGAEVAFFNGSVGGWTSADGVSAIESAFDVATNNRGKAPELCIIAFGMNDASHNVTPETYKANVRAMIESVRMRSPDTDIVIISTIRPNPECSQDKTLPGLYAEADKELCEEYERAAEVDMTAFTEELYKTKQSVDVLANNVNHPSDFLVRCYVMCLLKALV